MTYPLLCCSDMTKPPPLCTNVCRRGGEKKGCGERVLVHAVNEAVEGRKTTPHAHHTPTHYTPHPTRTTTHSSPLLSPFSHHNTHHNTAHKNTSHSSPLLFHFSSPSLSPQHAPTRITLSSPLLSPFSPSSLPLLFPFSHLGHEPRKNRVPLKKPINTQ